MLRSPLSPGIPPAASGWERNSGVSIQPPPQHGAGMGSWSTGQGCQRAEAPRDILAVPSGASCGSGLAGTRGLGGHGWHERGEKGWSKGWGQGVPQAGKRDVGPALGGHRGRVQRGSLPWSTVGQSPWLSTAGCTVQTTGQVPTARHGTAQHCKARASAPHGSQLSTAAHSWRGLAQQGVTWHCTTPLGAAWHSSPVPNVACFGMALHSSAWFSTAGTAQHGMAWHGTAQRDSVQHR